MNVHIRFQMNENMQRRIQEIICEIEEKSAGGNYIYRGEPETHEEHPYHGKITSSLWRDFVLEIEDFNIEAIQTEILADAKSHIGDLPQDYRVDLASSLNMTQDKVDQTIDFEILTEIQHYGGKTNLIDFTTDYLIALFFACDGHFDDPGRIILQKTEEIQDIIERPRNPWHRVSAQKSIFVRPPKGFIDKPHEDNVVIIESDLKQWILWFLQQRGISTETIYNDVHGFIRHQYLHGDAYTHFYRGYAYQERGDKATDSEEKQEAYKKSIEHYTVAANLNPNNAPVYNNRGLAYFKSDKFRSAIGDFTTAIQFNPNYVDAYNNRGLAYYKKDEAENAIKDFTKAIQLNPNDDKAYNNRGRVYTDKGDYDLAIVDCGRAIEITPDEPAVYGARGVIYGRKGDYELAIEDFTKAINLNHSYPDAYRDRGYIYMQKGDYELAIADCNHAIELAPKNSSVYNSRGVVYYKRGNYGSAIIDYTKAIELDPNGAEAHYKRGEVRLHLEEWREAKIDLVRAKDMGIDIVAVFHEEYEDVADFQKKAGITLPEDIAEMLTPIQG